MKHPSGSITIPNNLQIQAKTGYCVRIKLTSQIGQNGYLPSCSKENYGKNFLPLVNINNAKGSSANLLLFLFCLFLIYILT